MYDGGSMKLLSVQIVAKDETYEIMQLKFQRVLLQLQCETHGPGYCS